ncbi:MAG: glycosyltransferase, partial [Bacteroidia bacterium]|nr:glycosyltransferase [Bacteroidia bacterium]
MDIVKGQSNAPLVSVISINYNHAGVTCKMLESLTKVTYPNLEVIVIDNGSPED